MARNDLLVVGFKDEASLVRRCAAELKARMKIIATDRYRAGELNLVGPSEAPKQVLVAANVREPAESLLRVLSLAHELRHVGAKRVVLLAPWIAYGRQDRATRPGEEPIGLMVGKLLASMFDRIVTLDAHSPAFIESFNGKLVNVLSWATLKASGVDLVAAPDHGAMERASLAADALGVPFIVIEKIRNGKRVVSKIQAGTFIKGARVLIVDDMADSGGTLKAAARALKKSGAWPLKAVVTHAFDLKRLKRQLQPEIKKVEAVFDHASGEIDPVALDYLVRQASLA